MAHNLTENTAVAGGYEMGYRFGTPTPWHTFGVQIPVELANNAEKFSEAGGVAWRTRLAPFNLLSGKVADCALKDAIGQMVVRIGDTPENDRPLACVGVKWTAHQWADSCRFLQVLLDTGKCKMATVGSLSGGNTVFASIELEKQEVRKDDIVTSYFHHVNRNQYGSVFTGFWADRMVCANTVAIGEAAASSKLRVRHSKDVTFNVQVALECIDLENQKFAATVDQWRKLANVGFSPSDVRKYVERVFDVDPSKEEVSTKLGNQLDKVTHLALFGMGNQGGSLWDALNGVTQWLTYEAGHNPNSRTESLLFGANGKRLERATSIAYDLAGIGA